uniref:Uncharacterized protein n=1 Tax=Romanomermis culicivorax TaxID=13658 RepID=A0A915HJG3_ROMCU
MMRSFDEFQSTPKMTPSCPFHWWLIFDAPALATCRAFMKRKGPQTKTMRELSGDQAAPYTAPEFCANCERNIPLRDQIFRAPSSPALLVIAAGNRFICADPADCANKIMAHYCTIFRLRNLQAHFRDDRSWQKNNNNSCFPVLPRIKADELINFR